MLEPLGLTIALSVVCACIFAYLTFHIVLRWYISGHVPLSNGFETMQFMAWCCILLAFLSVLITYFGVNFLLGGLHSYAYKYKLLIKLRR